MAEKDIDDDPSGEIAQPMEEINCVDRGAGLNPIHVYLNDGGKCVCGEGPDLSKRKAR